MQYNDGRTENISGTDSAFSQGDFNEGYYYVRLFHDSLDNLSFPNTGMFTGITYRENKQNLGADSDYKQVVMTLSGANTYDRYSFFSRLILKPPSTKMRLITPCSGTVVFWSYQAHWTGNWPGNILAC